MSTLLDRAKETFAVILDFKEIKKLLYEGAVRESLSKAGRETFAFLMELEDEHIGSFEKARTAIEAGDVSNPYPALKPWSRKRAREIRQLIFDQSGSPLPGPQDLIALENALNVEQACVRFFILSLAEASSPMEKEFLDRMIEEEKQHMALLSDLGLHFSVLQGNHSLSKPSTLMPH